MYDQAERLRQLIRNVKTAEGLAPVKGNARVITVTSGKGGVGKTNFTVNLALALAKLGQKILIVDADLGTANVDVVLGCTSRYSLFDVLEDGVELEDVIAEGLPGIKYLSGGSGMHTLANLSEAQLSVIMNKIALFDGWADIILIDTGAGLSRNVMNFVVAADEVIIITTPEPTALTDAYAMMKTYLGYQGTAVLKLVVNRVTETAEGEMVTANLVKAAQRFLDLPLSSLGVIYEDPNLVKAVKKQQPVLTAFPGSVSARCIQTIARQLLYGAPGNNQSRGMKGFLQQIFEFCKR